jgi:hypothetical protein
MNTNCLEGVRCPRCLQDERVIVAARVFATVADNGIVDTDEHMWEDDALTKCPVCNFEGEWKQFHNRTLLICGECGEGNYARPHGGEGWVMCQHCGHEANPDDFTPHLDEGEGLVIDTDGLLYVQAPLEV